MSRNVRLLQRTLLALPGLVGVPLQPIVELLLVAVEAGVGASQAVHLPGHTILRNQYLISNAGLSICGTDLHVSLAVEVGHVPAVLLVVVVVGVGAVVAGGDALSVGGTSAVVEVMASLVSNLSSRAQSNLCKY